MKAGVPEKATRRVAVILEAGSASRSLLDIALPLLGRGKAMEMQGVFLEEAELRHAADLPFVKELCRVTFSVREFNSDQFERALALRMRTAQRALSVLAKRAGVSHSFRNVRGPAVSLLLETANQSDITIFEPARMISTAMASAPSRSSAMRRIVVAVDDTRTGRPALLAASNLAGGDPRRISVVLAPSAAADRDGVEQLFRTCLAGPPVSVSTPARMEADTLIEVSQTEGAAMLVLDARGELMAPETLRRLRQRLRCPICLVRYRSEGD